MINLIHRLFRTSADELPEEERQAIEARMNEELERQTEEADWIIALVGKRSIPVRWRGFSYAEGNWFNAAGYDIYPTHFQPLPEAPNE